MTLACKTADILALATQGLNYLILSQDSLVLTDERKAALTQLAMTVQAAAKLTDIAHVQALGKGLVALECKREVQKAEQGVHKLGSVVEQTQRIKAETERLGKEAEKSVAETGRLGKEAEKSVAETGRLHAEAEKVARETERAVAETERLKAQAIVVRSEKMRIDAETERLKAESTVGRSEKMRIDAETEWVEAETERTNGEEVQMNVDTEAEAEAEAEKAGTQAARAAARSVREKVEAERVSKEVESPVRVQEAEGAKPSQDLLTIEAELKQKKMAALSAVKAGDQPEMVQHLAKEIEELRNLARMQRARRRIERRNDTYGIP